VHPGSILFVCKGNICRSPFAEAIARSLYRNGADPAFRFASAGIDVERSLSPPQEAILAAKRVVVWTPSER